MQVLFVIDLDEEYIKDLYDDVLSKLVIEYLSNDELSDEEKIKRIVEYMDAKGIE